MLERVLRRTLFAAVLGAGAAQAAERLVVEDAWIRTAPPGATMRAGYASLHNAGTTPLVVVAAASDAFGDVSLHATVIEDGVARMRPLDRIQLAPGDRVTLEPGGRHLMLMQPREELGAGSRATVRFETEDGSSTEAVFVVRDAVAADRNAAH